MAHAVIEMESDVFFNFRDACLTQHPGDALCNLKYPEITTIDLVNTFMKMSATTSEDGDFRDDFNKLTAALSKASSKAKNAGNGGGTIKDKVAVLRASLIALLDE